jgi:hypothetical protein
VTQYELPLDLTRALRDDAIDRMARAARRHIRYEREKACKAIMRFRFIPVTAQLVAEDGQCLLAPGHRWVRGQRDPRV